MDVFRRENGAWVKKTAYQFFGGWSQISASEDTPTDTPQISTIFEENDWATISQVSEEISSQGFTSGDVASIYGWNIGDTKGVILSTGETIGLQIIGINHDDKSDGTGKAGLTLQMLGCLATTYPFGSADTNAGGYASSMMKNQTLPTIKATLPQELQDVIKIVDKKSANGGGTSYSETLTTSEDIFLLSEIEVFGTSAAQAGSTEGERYEYYEINDNTTSRTKYYDADGDGMIDTATTWWTRSCRTTTTMYRHITAKGVASQSRPTSARGVAFGLCI